MLPQPRGHLLDGGDLARAVVLPQAAEAAHLPLEVARRPAEPLEAGGLPVHGVDLHERVDELLAHAPPVGDVVERGRDLAREDVPLDPAHDEERRADDARVLAHREHLGNARRPADRAQHARLAPDVVGARRQRRPRRASDHAVPAVAHDHVGDVRVALADGRRLDGPGTEPALVEEALERFGDEQRRPIVARRLLEGADDVVPRVRVHADSVGAPAAAGSGRAQAAQPGNDRAVLPPSTSRIDPLQ